MVFSRSLFWVLAMGVIPKVFASPIDLENGLLARDGKTPILVPFTKRLEGFLFVEVLVGSQKSPLSVVWDTGSYVFGVPNINITCDDVTYDCKAGGMFDPLNSTTYVNLGEHWGASYTSGGGNYGWSGADQVSIGNPKAKGATLKDFPMVVEYQATFQGILGMALGNYSDPNYLPTKLRAEGHITRAAFSYWHDSPESDTGAFLLGGLDEAKYEGDLIAVPRMKSEGGMKIPISKIVVGNELFTQGYPATLDTGETGVVLPMETVKNISATLGGGLNLYNGSYFHIPCEQPANKTIDFVFGENATVKVPVSEFIADHWNGYCALNIDINDYFLIGIPLQKYAYMVYDQDQDSISFAKPTYSNDSKIFSLPQIKW